MLKRIFAFALAAVLALCCLTACGSSAPDPDAAAETESNSLRIVTTIFPEYDWVNHILGDNPANADVTMLLDNGVDLHSYQPTAQDMVTVANCDLFLYVGGESDEWVKDALAESPNQNRKVISLLDALGSTVKEEEIVEGMEAEEEDEEEEGPEYDEHVWLSLKNANQLCGVIAEALEELDPDHADTYASNADAYRAQLDALDAQYQETADNAEQKTLLFGDRFPFRYLTDDYGLDYYAAFVGCSAETEASFETIKFLAGKADELGLKNIMTIESSDGKIAQTIIQTTQSKDQQILTLDSMQSTTSADVKNGTAYLSIMERNLDVLKQALGGTSR